MPRTTHALAMVALALMLAAGCTAQITGSGGGAGGGSSGTLERDQMLDPWSPLPDDIDSRQRILERRAIDLGNGLGRVVYARALNTELARMGVSSRYTAVTSVLTEDDAPDSATPAASCPYVASLANDGRTSLSCRYVAERARDTAYVDVVGARASTRLPSEFDDAPDPGAVARWYESASGFGIDGELSRSIETLRSQSACDQAPTPVESSAEAGVTLGAAELRAAVLDLQGRTPRTRCDFDNAIVTPALDATLARLEAVAAASPLCPGVSPSSIDDRVRFAEAESEYRHGIERGIRDAAVRESERLFREWVCEPPSGGGGGGSGDPLVLDLDGDGIRVEPTAFGPLFDLGAIGRVRIAWTEPGDAFVTLDRDGNGQIASTELFGDLTVTEDGMSARDGLEALALYDLRSRGGNGDGRIDSADAVYAALTAWSDVNGDARVQPRELRSLEDAAVASIELGELSFRRADGAVGRAADLLLDWVPVR